MSAVQENELGLEASLPAFIVARHQAENHIFPCLFLILGEFPFGFLHHFWKHPGFSLSLHMFWISGQKPPGFTLVFS